jgi:ABC-2 type transport system ATP-binding protein
MIEIHELCKNYGQVKAIRSVDLTIRDQQIFGLVGANGAGKSTLLGLLSDVLEPDSGWIHIDGQPIRDNVEVKRDLFYIPDEAYYFPSSTIAQMADYLRGFYPAFDSEKLNHFLDFFELDPNRSISTYSKGTRKQLFILIGLSAGARYLVLDETFDGLDVFVRQGIKALIRKEVKERGLTAVIASHNLAEVDDVCSHLCILHEGKVLISQDGISQTKTIQKVQCIFKKDEGLELVEDKLKIRRHTRQGSMHIFITDGSREDVDAVFRQADPLFYEFLKLSLEEVFFTRTEEEGYDIRRYTKL